MLARHNMRRNAKPSGGWNVAVRTPSAVSSGPRRAIQVDVGGGGGGGGGEAGASAMDSVEQEAADAELAAGLQHYPKRLTRSATATKPAAPLESFTSAEVRQPKGPSTPSARRQSHHTSSPESRGNRTTLSPWFGLGRMNPLSTGNDQLVPGVGSSLRSTDPHEH
jgi:hypothetical protein